MHQAQPVKPIAPLRTSLIRAGLALAVIACGLSLRWYGFPLGLPAFVVKYGGSLLWATMVFLLVGVLLPRLHGHRSQPSQWRSQSWSNSPDWCTCLGSTRSG